MRAFSFLAFASVAYANIVFTHVPLQCNASNPQIYHGCLRGQQCLNDGSCEALPKETQPRSVVVKVKRAYSADGKCGASNGGLLCDPNSTVYKGTCCSQYGWCGNTVDYCGTGCQSGCSNAPSSTSPPAYSTDGKCGASNGGLLCDPNSKVYTGSCCSQYGWCGNTVDHCGTGCQSGCSNIPPTAPPRADGQCGKAFGGATCDPNGPYGGCCSQYGYCGKTDGHCLVENGCQSGCTDVSTTSKRDTPEPTSPSEPVVNPVSTTPVDSNAPVTIDGTCGASNGNTICGDWPKGNCCSMYGFCGDTSAHCGAGCQSGNCISAPEPVPPGASPAPAAANPGTFNIVGLSGVPAMHAALMPNGRVFFLDKIENYTQLILPNGQYAYSAEYNPQDNSVVPLTYQTNAFCSGGTFLADGRVISVGGNAPLSWLDPTIGDGFNAIRYLNRPSDDSQDGQGWSEPGNKLASDRWYATAQTMPDGRVFVASGSLNGLDPANPANNNPTYEILSAAAVTEGNNIPLSILEKNQPYYMYPFVHLLKDGSLFIFVSKSAEQFSLSNNAVLRSYPDLPGDYRTYPNTGGSVLLPLSSANNWNPEIVICGGGAYQDITSPCDPSCGRMSPLADNPQWEMDSMPEARGMVEGTLLPDGTVLWLNGAQQGAQGFGLATDPALEALLYDPAKPLGQRFSTAGQSLIPRLYHSVALLLLDGTVMIAGSNPVQMPVLQPDAQNPFVTEFRVENYVPPYLQGDNVNRRPTDIVLSSKTLTADGSTFEVGFVAPQGSQKVSVVLYHGGFVTHSVHMGARMLVLDVLGGWNAGGGQQNVVVAGPPSRETAPPGPYVVFVVVDGVPGVGQFVLVQ